MMATLVVNDKVTSSFVYYFNSENIFNLVRFELLFSVFSNDHYHTSYPDYKKVIPCAFLLLFVD